MPTSQQIEQAIGKVKDQASLLQELLAAALEWPIPDHIEKLEDLGYGWSPDDLRAQGIEKKLLEGQVWQINLRTSQPWGIFVVEFAQDKVYRTVLRKVLRGLVPSRRRDSSLAQWKHTNLLFICTTRDYKNFTFAHFRGDNPHTSRLASFGWLRGDRHIRTLCEHNLPSLAWPENSDEDGWLAEWSAAFDVEAVTKRFFDDYAAVFHSVEEKIKGIRGEEPRRDYTQRLFNRLLFLYFIQRKGWLSFEGDKNYLRALYSKAHAAKEDFLNDRLYWTFFHGLNTINEDRDTHSAEELKAIRGEVPFLNGGLFDLEDNNDVQGNVKLPNASFAAILDLFERYNFTVSESTPLDVEVAVDPEMLGKVFEELVTGRHESGSYYTPRPIVAFMCREALKHYLARLTPDAASVARFVDAGDPSGLTSPEQVLQALKDVKVCDPACGSGAYLLGMMQELLRLREALFVKHKSDHGSIYDRKLEIIQNNLYGVDLDKFAVNIAKLRLWLSLVVDFVGTADKAPPLPNLDFKIECGDSLSASDPQTISSLLRSTIDSFAQELTTLKSKFIKSHGAEKKELAQQIDSIEDKLRENSLDENPEGSIDWRVSFAEVFKNGGFDIALENPPYVRMELFKSSKPRLKEVFPQVYDGSADLYVYFFARTHQVLKPGGVACVITTNKWLKAGYAEGLRRFFATSAWVASVVDFGHAKQIFQSADVFPSIVVFCKPNAEPAPLNARVCAIPREKLRLEEVDQQFARDSYQVTRDTLSEDPWNLESADVNRVLDKLSRNGIPVWEFAGVEPLYGIKTGLNDAFIVDRGTRDRLIAEHDSSSSVLKPTIRGRDMTRWVAEPVDLWLLYIPWHFPLHLDSTIVGSCAKAERAFARDYPAIFGYIKSFKKELSDRNQAETGTRYEWYALQRWGAEYWQHFKRPKICIPRIAYHSRACLDNVGYYLGDSAIFIPTTDEWLAAVLNSAALWYYSFRTLPHKKDEALAMDIPYVRVLPIPKPSDAQRSEVSTNVGQIVKTTSKLQGMLKRILDNLQTQFSLDKLSQKLQDPAALSEVAFIVELQKAVGKRKPLSAAAEKSARDIYAKHVVPLQALAAEARGLERRVSDLVNEAYGLTPEDVALMWKTAPLRMPGEPPRS